MPKKTEKEIVQGRYFRWLVGRNKAGIYIADGRSNTIDLGRNSLGTTSKTEALVALKKLDAVKAVEHGLADKSILDEQNAKSLTLEESRDLYFESVRAKESISGGSNKTLKRYRAVFDKFLRFCKKRNVGSCAQITKRLVESYAVWLDDDGYAYRTRYLEITTIKQFVKFLVDEGHLPRSSLIKIKMPKASETDAYCYRPEEVTAILEWCEQDARLHWLYYVLATLAYTGMRISELAALRWSDLVFDRAEPFIRLTDERFSARRTGGQPKRELKGKRGREFPIHPALQPILAAIPQSRDGKVLHGPSGGKLKPDLVRRTLIRDVLKPLAKDFPLPAGAPTGFRDGRVHSFRHFFCSMCADDGVREQVLMQWMGHRNSQMVRRYYHLRDDVSQSEMRKVRSLTKSQPRAEGPQSSGEVGRPQP